MADGNEGTKYLDKGLVSISYAPFVSFYLNSKAVDVCGLPYKNFFIYMDDTEYSKRLIYYFKPGYLVGKSIVIHGTGEGGTGPWDSYEKTRIRRGRYLIRNALVTHREYHGRKAMIRLHLRYLKLTFRLLFGKRVALRLSKVKEVFLGYAGYYSGSYDRKAFKKRFENHKLSDEMDVQ